VKIKREFEGEKIVWVRPGSKECRVGEILQIDGEFVTIGVEMVFKSFPRGPIIEKSGNIRTHKDHTLPISYEDYEAIKQLYKTRHGA
jgi:hypothetical protein